ncbi:MAG: flagellar hook-length control protein FliK [Hyphomicrobium sp.]
MTTNSKSVALNAPLAARGVHLLKGDAARHQKNGRAGGAGAEAFLNALHAAGQHAVKANAERHAARTPSSVESSIEGWQLQRADGDVENAKDGAPSVAGRDETSSITGAAQTGGPAPFAEVEAGEMVALLPIERPSTAIIEDVAQRAVVLPDTSRADRDPHSLAPKAPLPSVTNVEEPYVGDGLHRQQFLAARHGVEDFLQAPLVRVESAATYWNPRQAETHVAVSAVITAALSSEGATAGFRSAKLPPGAGTTAGSERIPAAVQAGDLEARLIEPTVTVGRSGEGQQDYSGERRQTGESGDPARQSFPSNGEISSSEASTAMNPMHQETRQHDTVDVRSNPTSNADGIHHPLAAPTGLPGMVRNLQVTVDQQDYGSLNITMRLQAQAVDVMIETSNSKTAELLTGDQSSITAALKQHGLDVGSYEVNVLSAESGAALLAGGREPIGPLESSSGGELSHSAGQSSNGAGTMTQGGRPDEGERRREALQRRAVRTEPANANVQESGRWLYV